MLSKMSAAGSITELEELVPELLDITENYVSLIKSGQANPMDLVIRRNTNKEASEYMNNSISACVTKMLEKSGVHISAGEAIEFIITNQSPKFSSKYRSEEIKAKPLSLYSFEDGYDIPKYTELLLKAAETLLQPFGYDYEKLTELFNPKEKLTRKIIKKLHH